MMLFSNVVPSLPLQLCESLEELLNVNGELRGEGQAMWTLLGGILGQVQPQSVPPTTLFYTHRLVVVKVWENTPIYRFSFLK